MGVEHHPAGVPPLRTERCIAVAVNFRDAECSVQQGRGKKHDPLIDPIACTGVQDMAFDRSFGDFEDLADLPVALAAKSPQKAVALTTGQDSAEHRQFQCLSSDQPARAIEGETARNLGKGEPCAVERAARTHGKGAGARHFALEADRNREPVADPLARAKAQHVAVARGEIDIVADACPGKTTWRDVTCPVDRIANAQCMPVIIVGPLFRIIVQMHRVLACGARVNMMGEREIIEVEAVRQSRHGCPIVLDGRCVLNLSGQLLQQKKVWLHSQMAARAASWDAGDPAPNPFPMSKPATGVSCLPQATKTVFKMSYVATQRKVSLSGKD